MRPGLTTRRGDCTYSYVACADCGTLFLSSVPSAEFLRELYQQHESLSDEQKHSSANAVSAGARNRSPLFRPHLWPPGSGRGRGILDIGCSSGGHLRDFLRRGWHVAGVDIDAAAIARAREAMPSGTFRIGDPAEVAFDPESFDVIRLDNTLEHVPDPQGLLAHARPWLRRRGILIAYVPHGRSASIRAMGEHSVNIWPPFHLQLFSRQGLKRVLLRAGYPVARCWGYTPRGILASSIAQWRRGSYRSGAAPVPTAAGRVVESAVWPFLAVTRTHEELIGVGRVL
jgi:SAM-dependent methyltransferase